MSAERHIHALCSSEVPSLLTTTRSSPHRCCCDRVGRLDNDFFALPIQQLRCGSKSGDGELSFAHRQLGPASGIVIASCISLRGCLLRALDVSHNRLGDDAALAIANALRSNTTLASLDMSSVRRHMSLQDVWVGPCAYRTQQPPPFISRLAERLTLGTSLTHLVLSGNFLGVESACLLLRSLRRSRGPAVTPVPPKLLLLDLRFNRIGREAGTVLVDALREVGFGEISLGKLDMRFNEFSDEGGREVRQAALEAAGGSGMRVVL